MCSRRNNLFKVTTFVLICVVVSGKTIEINSRAKRSNCNSIREHLNVSLSQQSGKGGSICGGECCDDIAENVLRERSREDFAALLRHKTHTVQGLLSFTAATLQSQVMELSWQSENKTRQLFLQVYKGMSVFSSQPINILYTNIRNYIQNSDQNVDIRSWTLNFFADLFPLVYHRLVLNTKDNSDFSTSYKSCLKKTVETIQPFGDVPKQTTQSLVKSLEITRLLLHSFKIGSDVLNATDRLLIDENGKSNYECHNALLKMTYCPKCSGVTNRPCVGYCYNVLRGCLTKYVAELDTPWNGYVDGVESLIAAMRKGGGGDGNLSIETIFKSLDSKISDAIMKVMQNGQDILNKVKRNCGPTDLSATIPMEFKTTSVPTVIPYTSTSFHETKLFSFLSDFTKTRGFYGNLADTLCKDENFVEQNCWTGERIGEYTKTVVDVGLDMQKYNPEVKPLPNTQTIDPRVAELVEKLRQVHHMALASSGGVDTDYMQRDGVEGSASGPSGNGPSSEFEEPDEEEASGSGHGIDEDGRESSRSDKPPKQIVPSVVTTGGSTVLATSWILVTSCLLIRL